MIIIILLLILIILYFNQRINNFNVLEKTYVKRYVWTYWENKLHPHINLCFKTMKKHLSKYNFIILNENNIRDYLPDIRSDLNHLLIAQKVDYYRIALLKKYGGIWLDADTIIMRNLDEIFNKLDEGYDFIGFGCTGLKCFNGYPKPSNGVMASRPNGILISCCLDKLDKIIQPNKKYEYFDLGKKIIWECLNNLMKTNYAKYYYHYPSEYDGSRDINGHWVHTPNHFSYKDTILLDANKAFFIFLANNEICNDNAYKWVLNLSENEILHGPWWISRLFITSLEV